ncbi:MAG: MFS transporter, partial [Caulobacteraceae bacterium]
VEAAPPGRRGLYLALQYATQDFAVMVAGVVGFTLSALLAPADLDAWGWRAAFLIGAAIVPFGLLMRRALPETHRGRDPAAPTARARAPVRIVALGLAIFAAGMIANYTLDYVTTYAQDSLKLAASVAFGATIVLGMVSVACDLICGALADKLGRKPVMLTAGVALILLTVPGYMLMIRFPGVATVYAVTAVLGGLLSLMTGPGLIIVTESLPRAVRSGALGTVYAFAVAGFGGTTQFVIKWLSGATHSALAPAWYMTAALVVGAGAMALMRETAPIKTGVTEDI